MTVYTGSIPLDISLINFANNATFVAAGTLQDTLSGTVDASGNFSGSATITGGLQVIEVASPSTAMVNRSINVTGSFSNSDLSGLFSSVASQAGVTGVTFQTTVPTAFGTAFALSVTGSASNASTTVSNIGTLGGFVPGTGGILGFENLTAQAAAPNTPSDGSDTLSFTGTGEFINGLEGNDSITVGNGNEYVIDGSNNGSPLSAENDTITAGSGNDTIWGGAGANKITVGGGNDLIINHHPSVANGGNSVITLGNGNGTDIVFAVSGNDTIFGGGGTSVINGGSGSVSIVGGSGLTLMAGGTNGASTLSGGSGPSLLLSTSGHDSITGGTGGDTILAAGSGTAVSGGDTVKAGGGADLIVMTAGSETVSTNLGSGKVTLNVGGFSAANQQKTITLGTGADTLVLGSTVSGSFAASDTISVSGYKVGTDHFILQGLGEHSLSALTISSSGSNTNISVADVGTIVLVGVSSANISAADFSFA